MKKLSIIALLFFVTLCGCSAHNGGSGQQAGQTEINEQAKIDGKAEGQTLSEHATVTSAADTEIDSTADTEIDSTADTEITTVPTKEEVLAMREQVLEGMSEEEAQRLTENIKVANLSMESAYLNDNIFERLEDADDLYWNYFDEKGEIQVGWAYDGSHQEIKAVMDQENLSLKEFYIKYGTPVTAYNRFDAGNFVELIGEMKGTVQNDKLQDDLQRIMDETGLAAETHEMQHAYAVYQLLHDMDYYLLRYGPEDVGKYVRDKSTVSKYYGVLSVYGFLDDK